MRKHFSIALLAVLMAFATSGCRSTPDGRMKAGVPFVKDTIESRYQRTVPQIFKAAREVLAQNGTLTSENTINNTLEAKVDTRTVIVTVDEVEPGVTRIRTQARTKSGGGDIDLAAEIDKQVALRLR
jgi:hypothetical protein